MLSSEESRKASFFKYQQDGVDPTVPSRQCYKVLSSVYLRISNITAFFSPQNDGFSITMAMQSLFKQITWLSQKELQNISHTDWAFDRGSKKFKTKN